MGDGGILWSTDGTAEGTRAVSSSLCPFPCQGIKPLAVWQGLGLLQIWSGDTYNPTIRLWRTDGTTGGTIPLMGSLINAVETVFSPGFEVFYFTGCRRSPPYGCALWRSDWTPAGTSAVQDAHGTTFYDPHGLTFWRGRLYFVATNERGDEAGLWSTDGTPGGTAFVTAVGEGSAQWSILQATSSQLFFGSGETAEDLWVTDGTPESTRRLLDLNRSRCPAFTDTRPPGPGGSLICGRSHPAPSPRSIPSGTESSSWPTKAAGRPCGGATAGPPSSPWRAGISFSARTTARPAWSRGLCSYHPQRPRLFPL